MAETTKAYGVLFEAGFKRGFQLACVELRDIPVGQALLDAAWQLENAPTAKKEGFRALLRKQLEAVTVK